MILIMMSLLEKNSDLTMSEVTVVLLDFESLRQREEMCYDPLVCL
jgi:hypothetical protein